MDKNEVINIVKKYKDLLKDNFEFDKVYLYGSYSKDTYKEDSDIDVAIIASNISDDFFATNPLLWRLRRQIDDRIEPLLIDKNNDPAGFLDEIERTGIEL